MYAGEQLCFHRAGGELDHTHGALARHRALVDPDIHAAAGGPDGTVERGTPPALVAHVGFARRQHDVERRNADLPAAQHAPVGSVEFEQAVRKIRDHVEPAPVGGNEQAGRDLGGAPGGVCQRKL